jgi:site-specific recombinase XerD
MMTDIRYIQAILGHEDRSATQVYTQIAINKLKEIRMQT